MSAVRASPQVHKYVSPSSWKGDRSYSLFQRRQGSCSSLSFRRLPRTGRRLRCGFGARTHRAATPVRAGPTDQALVAEPGRQEGVDSSGEILFEETFPLNRVQKVEGKVSVKLDAELENGGGMRKLVIGCNLEGNWVLHWGVTYRDDSDSEWDVPPASMIPAGSVPIKDYAMETPLKKSRPDLKGNTLNEVTIAVDLNSPVAAIHFVLKEEDTGNWYHNQGRDFSLHLLKSSHEEVASTAGKKHVGILKGAASKISNLIMESNQSQEDHGIKSHVEDGQPKNYPCIEELYEEYPIIKEEITQKSATISVTKSANKGRYFLHFDTDIPGKIILHWGVCKYNSNKWEILGSPYPPHTRVFRNKALRTLLQQKSGEVGSWTILPLERGIQGFSFLLKLEDGTWLRDMGNDFYIPLSTVDDSFLQSSIEKESMEISREQLETNEIINDIRNLVTDISSEKKMITTSKEAQESILEEIEKLAAEAYSIFRSTTPAFVEDIITESERSLRVPSAAGSGYEILCQGFNWESHSSGKWYRHLRDKVGDLYNIGFTGVWLPPPTESVSPQGYMPKDLYNLNSSYGSLDDLKNLINKFHEFDINVIGDVVLNHRCAHFQNSNGVWNIFGGQLNWDDRAVVCDDPHFQGRGNKSSGEQFHAAPNIDHSQEFVRNDLKDWLLWLRDDIGFDGWRLDFVRGFWGGYTKDYMEASKPHFAVGEFWDSLSYTYGQMDHNQDAHRQRIIDWINATNGTSAAFDITTKGIFHVTLENCEYWRLSDSKGKPPGLLGWWPSRAVTFIENHDTGSTQGHWRFPCGKEMQGYAYILTHPGTPSVFCDHVFSHLQQEIAHLISIRRRLNINCRSSVKIKKAERDVYAAEIDEKLVMKIGPGHYEPHGGSSRWVASAEGRDYKIWELA